MLYLMNWRVWLIAVVLVLYPIAYLKGRSDGKQVERAHTAAAIQDANREAHKNEQRRQRNVDEAATAAAARERGIAADADRVRDAVGGLRNALAAKRSAEESAASATARADALGKLLVEGAEAHRELAQRCDRHVSDLRMLLDAWPK